MGGCNAGEIKQRWRRRQRERQKSNRVLKWWRLDKVHGSSSLQVLGSWRLWRTPGAGFDARFSKLLPCFRPKTVIFHTRFQTLPVKSIFNFGRKDQLTKKKDRILIKDLISNKWKNKTKEARLILQSGKYISLPIFRKARPSFFRVLHTMIKVKLNLRGRR